MGLSTQWLSEWRRPLVLVAIAVGLQSCSPAGNRVSSPRLRGASSAIKPCPNSAKNTTAPSGKEGSALALTNDSRPQLRKSGGFILTEGYGIAADLESHKSRVTFSDGSAEQLGNPKGLIDVVNIPACTEARPSIDRQTLRRCVSRASWEELILPRHQGVLSRLLSEPWAPRTVFKQCTASVTIDGHDFGDLLSSGRSSGVQRVRVWTAEHCYQSSYAKNVHLFLPTDDVIDKNVAASNYISLPLHKVDGIEFSRTIIAKNGGGGRANDPNLNKKMFILRSMDGRSADSYKVSVGNGCLLKGRAVGSESPFSKSKFVDCFTTADLATFKASINLASLAENPFNELVTAKSLSDVRLALVRDILIKEKRRYDLTKSKGKELNPLVQGLLQLLETFGDVFGIGELFVSQMDGIGHSRRVEAMVREQREFAINELSDLGDFSKHLMSYRYDPEKYSEEIKLVLNLVRYFAGSITTLGCSVPGTQSDSLLDFFKDTALSVGRSLLDVPCPEFVMSPPDTAALEVTFYQPNKDLNSFLKQNLSKLVITVLNPKLDDAHPLKIKPTDDEVQVSAKMGAIWTRLSFESALMRQEPFAEVSEYNALGKFFQQVLKVTCPDSEFANQLFPVFLNRKVKSRMTFAQFGLLGPGTIKIMPIVGTDVGSEVGFNGAMCGGRAEVAMGLGPFVQRGVASLPADSTVAIDVDDKLLCLPVASAGSGELYQQCSAEQIRDAAINYMGRRVIYRFEGAQANEANVVAPTDSGTLWTLLGLPAFALSSHNGDLVNGVVFDRIPDINTVDPDRAAPATDAQGNPVGTCN